jgi:ElaB/YqjD/DUF883 family membrane-anchored ribosome-binding protein
MTTNILTEHPIKNLKETAGEAAHQAAEAAKDAYQTVSAKVEDTMIRTKDYVGRNPIPVALGALAVGAVIGALIMMARRPATLRERFMEDPLHTSRDVIYAALAPIGKGLHDGYDSARNGADKAWEKLRGTDPSHAGNWISEQIRRVQNSLKS